MTLRSARDLLPSSTQVVGHRCLADGVELVEWHNEAASVGLQWVIERAESRVDTLSGSDHWWLNAEGWSTDDVGEEDLGTIVNGVVTPNVIFVTGGRLAASELRRKVAKSIYDHIYLSSDDIEREFSRAERDTVANLFCTNSDASFRVEYP